MCCNFDHFGVCHSPVDEKLQGDVAYFFKRLGRERGFDNRLGRRLGTMFRNAGLTDIGVDFIPERA